MAFNMFITQRVTPFLAGGLIAAIYGYEQSHKHHNEVRSVLAACNPSRAGALQRASLPASEAPTPRSLFSPELLASQYNRALLSLHGRVSEFLQKPPEKEEQAQQA